MKLINSSLSNPSPRVSVLIPVRNGEDYIERAIKSVLNQSYNELRLIISDNDSSDGTSDIIQRYCIDRRVRLNLMGMDRGINANMMYLLDQVESDYFMFLSHDDFFVDDSAIQRSVALLDEHPSAVMALSDTIVANGRGEKIFVRRDRSRTRSCNDLGRKSIILGRNLFGIPILYRSSMVKAVALDKSYPNTCDIDFCMQAGKDAVFVKINEPLIAVTFHKKNNTAHNIYEAVSEFYRLVVKYQLNLNIIERMMMRLNAALVPITKRVFFKAFIRD